MWVSMPWWSLRHKNRSSWMRYHFPCPRWGFGSLPLLASIPGWSRERSQVPGCIVSLLGPCRWCTQCSWKRYQQCPPVRGFDSCQTYRREIGYIPRLGSRARSSVSCNRLVSSTDKLTKRSLLELPPVWNSSYWGKCPPGGHASSQTSSSWSSKWHPWLRYHQIDVVSGAS